MDGDAQIGVDGDVVGEFPGDDDEDGPRGQEQSPATHVGAPRVWRMRPCRAVDEDGRCRSMPLSE
jgi:hypothetical protein